MTSGAEARPPDRLARVDIERIAAEFVRLYPRRRYPAAALGSSKRGAVLLRAALGSVAAPDAAVAAAAKHRPAGI